MESWISELQLSLHRAGDHVLDAPVIELGNGTYAIRLWQVLPDEAKTSVKSYIKLFAKEHGHTVTKVSFKKFAIEFSTTLG